MRRFRFFFVMVAAIAGAAACASTGGARPVAFPGAPVPSAARDAARVTALRQGIVETALALRGVQYRLGGADPATGFDCSGLVQYVFTQHAVDVPRTVAELYDDEPRLKTSDVGAGDLIFFAIDASEPTHVGIAIDDRQFVHAPGTGRVVRVERFDTPYWQSHFKGAARPVRLQD